MIKFGTDGWRGIIAEDFTYENLKIVSQAIADYLKKGRKTKVVIGYDARFLSRECAVISGLVLAANGIKVTVSKERVPAPVVSFNTRYEHYDLGIMITASHNPFLFNGLKIKTRDGGAADRTLTDKVERLLYKHKPKMLTRQQAEKRKLFQEKDLTKKNKEYLKKFVDIKKIRKLKLRILMDLMYGSGGTLAQDIISSKAVTFDYLHREFNPSFNGVPPEPVERNLQELLRRVKKEKYDLGVALDGDADRIALVNSRGEFITAQEILPLLAVHMIKNRGEKAGIGKTVVGSNLIDSVALAMGVGCFETHVGFKYISNLFKEKLISIGGEEAGGIGFKGYIPERDGAASLLMVLEMIACERKSFTALMDEVRKKYGRWYYTRTSISLKSFKKSLKGLPLPSKLLGRKVERVNRVDGIKLITKVSWLSLRKSGTEPIVRIYAEAKSKKERDALIALGEKIVHVL